MRKFLRAYAKEFYSSTLNQLKRELFIQLGHYFNDGDNVADIGNLEFESALPDSDLPTLKLISSGTVLCISLLDNSGPHSTLGLPGY